MKPWVQYRYLTHQARAEDFDKRRQLISQLLGVPETEAIANSFRVCRTGDLYVREIFDELNNSIGEAWFWDYRYFYFARESDAIWFTMRWQ